MRKGVVYATRERSGVTWLGTNKVLNVPESFQSGLIVAKMPEKTSGEAIFIEEARDFVPSRKIMAGLSFVLYCLARGSNIARPLGNQPTLPPPNTLCCYPQSLHKYVAELISSIEKVDVEPEYLFRLCKSQINFGQLPTPKEYERWLNLIVKNLFQKSQLTPV